MTSWNIATIGSVCSTFSGGTPSTSNSKYYGGDIPWIASGDLNQVRITSVKGRITRLGLEQSSAKLVESGTPLIALYGATAGVSAMTFVSGAINQAVMALIPRSIDAEYLLQWLRANRENIIERYTQGGQPNLSGSIVRSIELPLPPAAEQRRIANALRDADDQITVIECLISKNRAIKRALMQKLLNGDRRLPGFSGSWHQVRLSDIGRNLIGLTYSPENVRRAGTLVLRSSNIQDGQLRLDDNVYVNCPIPDRIRVREHDLLLCVRNGSRQLIGKSLMLDKRVVGQTFGAFMAVYRSSFNPYLRYFFQSDGFKRQIDEHLGATINQITNGSLNRFVVDLPGLEEQRAIMGVLVAQDDILDALQAKLVKAIAVKSGMVRDLLLGRRRLPLKDVSS